MNPMKLYLPMKNRWFGVPMKNTKNPLQAALYTEYISTRWYRAPECLTTLTRWTCGVSVVVAPHYIDAAELRVRACTFFKLSKMHGQGMWLIKKCCCW